MRKFAIAGAAAIAIAASTAVYAQHHWFGDRMGHARMSVEDRAALADARVAAVHAGLKLSPDQEKLWGPVESAVRDLVKIRIDRAKAQEAAAAKPDEPKPDPVTRLRDRAERMAVTAAALKKIADAADPLYKTLDEGQKRRLTLLTQHRPGFGGEGWRHRFGGDRMEGERDGGGGSERL
jgi:LTXXQ motif family protein